MAEEIHPWIDQNSNSASDQRKRNVEKEDKGICGKHSGGSEDDWLGHSDIWMEMNPSLECSKGSKFIIANASDQDFGVAEVPVHPSHMEQMKPHNIEGFNFSLRNIVCCSPAGCILAHTPGSGKTFMIIKYMQNFLGEYLNAIPLCSVVQRNLGYLEEGDVFKEQKGILFLGYEQFASIVSNSTSSTAAAAFHDILLRFLLYLFWMKKVVLYGSLSKNHVEEVFNILNFVLPEFLKLDTSKNVLRRITSGVQIAVRKQIKIEETVQNDQDFQRKVTMIQNLCEMRQGGSLDELPGLVGFTVLLTLNPKQKHAVVKMKKLDTFKRSSISRTYKGHINEAIFFFLTILLLCESAGEKMLVFSQYLLPLNKGKYQGFNNSKDAKVFFVSIKALILDIHLNPSVTRQAIGRAFRPGRPPYMLPQGVDLEDVFEWSEICGYRNFAMKEVNTKDLDDSFWDRPSLGGDVVDCLFLERYKFLWISLTSLRIMSYFLYIWELGHTASV
ncbi:hypothetical protein MKX03_014729 [Papaver bracteatum]|nr:hypothetical protein MKX03_014729 [Papaver bracteatum]